MAELKTKKNDRSVTEFLQSISDRKQRLDAMRLLELFKSVTRKDPEMWGTSIVGFGNYRYRYESGREGDWFLAGFSPRKENLTLYSMSGFDDHPELLQKLGKYKTGKACLYIKRLADVDWAVLKKLIQASVARSKRKKK